MRLTRPLLLTALILTAVVAQITLLPRIGLTGVVPDVVLVLVVAVGLADGAQHGATIGFCAGLVLDLAPPADHTVGRWALTFVLVGYLASLVRLDAQRSAVATSVVVAASAFVGTSLFALSGMVVGDRGVTVAGVLGVIPLAVAYDVLLGLVLVPMIRTMLTHVEPVPARW